MILQLRIPPAILFLACVGVGWSLSLTFPTMAFDSRPIAFLAIIFIAAGFLLLISALIAFSIARTTINPLEPDGAKTLVTTGIFRLSRNPMYLAMALILLGGAMKLGNFAAFGAPLVFMWSVTCLQIRPEEITLRKIFGTAYTDYQRHTRRWI